MSGGSYDYVCYKLSNECEGRMYDAEMNDLVKDLSEVLHDLEWWQSGDYSEEQYRETVSKFKKKWFEGDRTERLKGYIDDQIDAVRRKLYSLIGEPQESEIADESCPNRCIDCENFNCKEYYADNATEVSPIAWGSCTKCQRNFVTIDPYNQVPSWCPLKKGEEDEKYCLQEL